MISTIGFKIAGSFAIIIILMVAMVLITTLGYNDVVKSLDAIEQQAVKRGAAANFRFSVAQLLMAVNDYIITENKFYREDYERLNARVDNFKRKLLAIPLESDEEMIITEISWLVDSIRYYAEETFTISRPRSSGGVIKLMETMDYQFGDAVNRKTTELFDLISERIEGERVHAVAIRERVRDFNYIIVILGTIVSIVVTFFSVRRITKPIVTVTKAANALANGDYSRRPLVPARDEIGVLASTFCRMADNIQQSRRALVQAKQLNESIVHSIPPGIIVFDKDKRVISVNRRFEEIFSLEAGQCTEARAEELLEHVGLIEHCREVIAERMPVENYECHCDSPKKGEMWISLTLTPFFIGSERNGENHQYLLVINDITEQKRMHENLQLSQARYRTFIQQSSEGIYRFEHEQPISVDLPEDEQIDQLFRYSYLAECNDPFAKMYGYSRAEDVLGLRLGDILYQLDPRNIEFLRSFIRSGYRLTDAESHDLDRQGKLHYYLNNLAGVIEHGYFIRSWGIQRDITERKALLDKQKSLETQLVQSQKLESLGTLAGGIAHDFNNILAIIIAYAAFLQSGGAKPENISLSINAILNAAQRGAALVRQILLFARKGDVKIDVVDVNNTVKDLGKILKGTFPKVVEIHLDLDRADPTITANADQLHQVLLNLCINARDAILDVANQRPSGGVLTISTRLVPAEQTPSQKGEVIAESYVAITVSDTGTGMTEETKAKIFEPFFTTKERGKGTRLGLAMVYGVVENHKGFIDVKSELGRGTDFILYFPVTKIEPKVKMPMKRTLDEIPCGSETILLVEDEIALLELIKNVLENKGYTVLTATDGLEAVEVFARNKDIIHLVVCDFNLPKLSGAEAFKRMKQINLKVKTVLASGFMEPNQKSEILKSGVKGIVQKPYDPHEVLRKVREVLDLKV